MRAADPLVAGQRAWHAEDATSVLGRLDVTLAAGLDDEEAARRLETSGRNVLAIGTRRSRWRILGSQFANVMVGVLFGAAVLAGVIGEPQDSVAILAILLLNALLGYAQESRAEDAVAALRAMAAPQARVRRDGRTQVIDAALLVPGDIVRVESGDMAPADLRVIECAQLRVAEAALTGESIPVTKSSEPVPDTAALGDRRSMIYRGTVVAQGRALGVVVETGLRTELGRIAELLGAVEPTRTPLQRRLASFTERLSVVILLIAGLVLTIGLMKGEPLGLMLLTAVSLAVAAIPEALPAVVTVALAFGARRAAARHALIRNLPAVETLGSVTYICTDKTGTLTENHMRLRALRLASALDVEQLPDGEEQTSWTTVPAERLRDLPVDLVHALAVNNDVERSLSGWRGDPTEIALVEGIVGLGADHAALVTALPRMAEAPFTSERGRMTTWHQRDGSLIAFTKGAPERVLPLCVSADGRADALAKAPAICAALAAQGMRVLVLAAREWDELPTSVEDPGAEMALRFLGVIGLQDPPRHEVRLAVAECRRAGIRVVMVTGDHPATAEAIAREIGIVDGVHARVTPEQKLALVESLQSRGEFVAMTGDGVNDAPALKRADIGIAMGRGGTDVAREASDLILLDDHFATIVNAVREGRRIYDNIRKFVRYALTCNSAEIWTLLLAPLVGLPIPLLPIHILWINLVTDGLPGLALTVEPAERRVMAREPRRPSESIFAQGLWQHALIVGLLMGGATLATQAYAWSHDLNWQSMTFTVLAFLQLGHLLAIRSEVDAFYRGFFRNRALLASVLLTVLLQLAVLYVPALNPVFGTEPLTRNELAFCFAISTVGFIAVELEKLVRRRLLRENPDVV
ncbi:MAG: cation-translocating P-type ATPase [Gemmatimonadaceae bacterium]